LQKGKLVHLKAELDLQKGKLVHLKAELV